MKSRRQEFLNDFLGALGAQSIDYTIIEDKLIEGFVTYDLSNLDPEGKQGFRWKAGESDVPSRIVLDLINVIHQDKLLDIDRLTVSKTDLFLRLQREIPADELEEAFQELLSISIPILDDGEEAGAYFIHQ